MNELYDKLADILEEDEVSSDDVLDEFEEWDSLSVLSIIAMIDSDFNVTITSEELIEISTVGDLENLINSKKD